MKEISEKEAFNHTKRFKLEKPRWRCRLNYLISYFTEPLVAMVSPDRVISDLECRFCCLRKGCTYYEEARMFIKQNPTCWNKHILSLFLGGIDEDET